MLIMLGNKWNAYEQRRAYDTHVYGKILEVVENKYDAVNKNEFY